MNRVPTEFWFQIFLACPHEEATFPPLESPWTFDRVWKLWRSIVRTAPSLWTTVSFPSNSRLHLNA
ncbi:hypothetical protein WG66_003649 [Moniliophthora roreri]|nr:hypothetical protein WG66_003649 [Moniliophthora roreri]